MNGIQEKKVLVTGGLGTIGSHIVDKLIDKKAREIVVYDNFSEGTILNLEEALKQSQIPIRVVSADIRDMEDLLDAMEGVDYVFHQASLLLLESRAKHRKAIEYNIIGTHNVFEACVKQGVKKIVFASSASVFGEPLYTPVDEKHPFNNVTFYGATKVACEQFAVNFRHDFDLDFVGLRYYNIYGPRQGIKGAYAQIIPKWFDAIQDGEPITIFGDGTQTMDLIYVTDAADCNILAMEKEVGGEFFNVGTGVGTSVKELAEMIMEVIGREVDIHYERQDVNLVKKRVCSTKKCKDILGFEAKVKPLEGLSQYCKWRRRQGSTHK